MQRLQYAKKKDKTLKHASKILAKTLETLKIIANIQMKHLQQTYETPETS
jgi:hypothetical protein